MLRLRPRHAVNGLALLLAACSAPLTVDPPEPVAVTTGPAQHAVHLVVRQAHWRLHTPLSRAAVLASANNLVVAGGLNANDASLSGVRTINPQTGRTISTGRLANPVHDAAAGSPSGGMFVFGGGETVSGTEVQRLRPTGTSRVTGSLPQPRSDLSAATVAGTTYLLGGYDGTRLDRSVLATTDGVHFTSFATLSVGVRYAAVVGTADELWVFGGERNGAPVDIVQRVDLASQRSKVVGHLPRPLSHASAVDVSGHIYLAGGRTTGDGLMATVVEFDPTRTHFRVVGQLPAGVSDTGAAVVGDIAYLVGGETPGVTNTVTKLFLRSGKTNKHLPAAADPSWFRPPNGPTYLAAGADPSALPSPILIADKLNNRLLIVDPQGRVRWSFPRKGDLRPGQSFHVPDDAFFSPDGTQIIATQEDNYVVSLIDIARHRIVYRYGTPGVPGSTPNHLNNPDDALLLRNGDILTADIKNCRILRIHAGSHRPAEVYGTTGSCYHQPPSHFGSPNGAFPMANGNFLVTEINGSWIDAMTPHGHVLWSEHVPGVIYPSDTNEISPGRFLTVDYSTPGQVVEFSRKGRTLWRWAPSGAQTLRQPSLALPLPNGDVLLNDDANHRVIVVDPRTNRIVWQYGRTGVAGSAPGLLNNPDGVDLLPPYQLMNAAHN